MGLWKNLAGTVVSVAAASAAGSVVTKPDGEWYRGLTKPSWQPPGIAFPLVWTPLYASIAGASAVALTRFAEDGDDEQVTAYRRALAVNLALNAGWSGVFFGLKNARAGVPVAVALAVSSADLARRAGKAGTGPGAALAPYAAWTCFASALNVAIVRLNPAMR